MNEDDDLPLMEEDEFLVDDDQDCRTNQLDPFDNGYEDYSD